MTPEGTMLSNSARARSTARRTTAAFAIAASCFLTGLAVAPGSERRDCSACYRRPAAAARPPARSKPPLIGAALSPGTDRIEIASGNYGDGPWTVANTNPVRIYGIGPTKPKLTGNLSSAAAVLTINNAGSTVSDVAIEIPASTGKIGLQAGANTEAIGVSVTGSGAVNATGIAIIEQQRQQDRRLRSESRLGARQRDDGDLAECGQLDPRSTIRRCARPSGVLAETSSSLDLQALKINSGRGVEFRNSTGTVSSSLLRYSPPLSGTGYAYGIRLNNTFVGDYTRVLGQQHDPRPRRSCQPGTALLDRRRRRNQHAARQQQPDPGLEHDATGEEVTAGSSTFSISYSRYDVTPASGTARRQRAARRGDLGFVNSIGGRLLAVAQLTAGRCR